MHSFKTKDFLRRVAQGLESTLMLPELKEPLASYGYDDNHLQEGIKLHENVISLQVKQADTRSIVLEVATTFQGAREGLEMIYRRHVAIARVAFVNDSTAWQKLQLDEKRKQTNSGTQYQAHLFYTHLENYLDQVEKYNLTREEIREASTLSEQLISLQVLQQQAKSQSQTLNQMKDENLDLLVSWWKRFTKTAHLAFKGKPQYLEVLGLAS